MLAQTRALTCAVVLMFAVLSSVVEAGIGNWTELNAAAYFPARSDQTISVLNGSLVATGAENYTVNYTVTNEVMQTYDGFAWTRKAPGPWSPRGYSASATYTDLNGVEQMLMSGGGVCLPPYIWSVCNAYNWFGDLWRTFDANSWEEITANGPRWGIRGGHTMNNLNGTIVLMGGLNNTYQFNDVWLSTNAGVTWILAPTAPWAARSFHAATTGTDSSGLPILYLAGGGDFNGDFSDLWMTRDGITWTQAAVPAWSSRFAHTMTWMPSSSKLVVTGGYHTIDKIAMNDVWMSADFGASWVAAPNATWTARSFHSAVVLPSTGQLLITGGWTVLIVPTIPYFQYAYFNDVWVTNV